MAHELAIVNGKASIAWVGETPWHGLGQELQPGMPLEVWRIAAGLDYSIQVADALYMDDGGLLHMAPQRRVLYRSDTKAYLSTMSDSYQLIQPREVLEFYRDLVSELGFELSTAGALFGGRKYWALAKVPGLDSFVDDARDRIKPYLLLATSCDGTQATTAQLTAIQVVCNNTLSMANSRGHEFKVRCPHSTKFDPKVMKEQLGIQQISDSFGSFIEDCRKLSTIRLSPRQAMRLMADAIGHEFEQGEAAPDLDEQVDGLIEANKHMRAINELFLTGGKHKEIPGSVGTAYGLLNAATEYFDHHRETRSADSRVDRSWFGDAARVKGNLRDLLHNIGNDVEDAQLVLA